MDKAKQTELQLITNNPAVFGPSDLGLHRLRLARLKIGSAWSCKEQWSPVVLPIERQTTILYTALINTALRQSFNTNPNLASDTVAFHPPLSYHKTNLSSLQTVPALVWTFQ